MWNRQPPARVMDACAALKARGLTRFVALSTHRRALVPELAAKRAGIDIFHVRYNAAHRGAETDVFARLPVQQRPGIVSFTATCWGRLLEPRRTPPGDRTPTAADCYRFVLTNPAVDVCMTGPASRTHVEAALEAARLGPLPPVELAWMRRVGDAVHGAARR